MSRAGPERKIQEAVIKYAREQYGALCKKNDTGLRGGTAGWPDYTIFVDMSKSGKNRAPFFMEFKRSGADLTPLQEHMKRLLAELGYKVYKIDGIIYGRLIIDKECE